MADAFNFSQGRSQMVYSQTLSLSLFLFLLDQVPDEGTIFNLFSIETNLGLLSEFREFVILIENFNQFTARDNSKNWVKNAIGD